MRLSSEELAAKIVGGDRRALARAITLIESVRPDDEDLAADVLARVGAGSRRAVLVGVSGPPGVGKSTFIEALGLYVVGLGKSLAVLAVDPSSRLTGGSILGDKTRMPRLSADRSAFVRPSPASDELGGVAARTSEAVTLCEAAGFDVIFVETVGVGQSETAVATMVDCFLFLTLPSSGDELQGIKRGIMELCDLGIVHKADGDLEAAAIRSARSLSAALRMLTPRFRSWRAETLRVSSVTGVGIEACWERILEHRRCLESSGELAELRATRGVELYRREVQRLMTRQWQTSEVLQELREREGRVIRAEVSPTRAAASFVEWARARLAHAPA